MKQDKKKTKLNFSYKKAYKESIKGKKDIKEVYSKIDKATKKGVLHKNKAARLKSQYAKLSKAKK